MDEQDLVKQHNSFYGNDGGSGGGGGGGATSGNMGVRYP
jgi:hypothetical protein